MRILKITATTVAAECTINRVREIELGIRVESVVPRRRERESPILPVEHFLVGRKMLC